MVGVCSKCLYTRIHRPPDLSRYSTLISNSMKMEGEATDSSLFRPQVVVVVVGEGGREGGREDGVSDSCS